MFRCKGKLKVLLTLFGNQIRQCSFSHVYSAAISLIWVFWGYFVQDKSYSSFLCNYCLYALISVELSSYAQFAQLSDSQLWDQDDLHQTFQRKSIHVVSSRQSVLSPNNVTWFFIILWLLNNIMINHGRINGKFKTRFGFCKNTGISRKNFVLKCLSFLFLES